MKSRNIRVELGFTLIELTTALFLTLIVSTAVFGLLTRGQRTFRREPEVSEMLQNARFGLARVSDDLVMAGYRVPGASSVFWQDGGLDAPDGITILRADETSPVALPARCGWGQRLTTARPVCPLLSQLTTLRLDVDSMDPVPADPVAAFPTGATLLAIEAEDCNHDDRVGVFALEIVGSPAISFGDSGSSPIVAFEYRRAETNAELRLPPGFNSDVALNCAQVGRFNVIQYRVRGGTDTDAPTLERRDLGIEEPWIPVAVGVENLQLQYMTGAGIDPVDTPPPPRGEVPETWITGVRVAIAARSLSRNLEGGRGASERFGEGYLQKQLATSVSLRNVAARAESYFAP